MATLTQTTAPEIAAPERHRVLWLSTIGFALLFAAWTMFGVLSVPIRAEFGLSEVQLAWLAAIAILNGSMWRLPMGMLADRWGGRRTFIVTTLCAAGASWLVSRVGSYETLLVCSFLVGIGGNSFTAGSAWNAAWFPKTQQGFAMGLFGAGNVGASVTKLIGPALIALIPATGILGGFVPGGWRFVPFLYAVLLLIWAAVLWAGTPRHDRMPNAGRPLRDMLRPLSQIRVWRFGLYYTVAFGAYVALSVTLPKYYVDVYDLPLKTAALVTTPFIFASSLLRPVGGYLSDRFGPRPVTYCVFGVGAIAAGLLSLPLGFWPFSLLVFLLGVTQGLGKASTIKYVPDYYPNDVGAVVGLVGALAGLGGFVLPLSFAYLRGWTGLPHSMFWVLCALSLVSLAWLHLVVVHLHREERHEI